MLALFLMLSEANSAQKYPGIIGLSLTSAYLVIQKIIQDECADFNIFLTMTTFVDTMEQPSCSQQPTVTKISLYATWMET